MKRLLWRVVLPCFALLIILLFGVFMAASSAEASNSCLLINGYDESSYGFYRMFDIQSGISTKLKGRVEYYDDSGRVYTGVSSDGKHTFSFVVSNPGELPAGSNYIIPNRYDFIITENDQPQYNSNSFCYYPTDCLADAPTLTSKSQTIRTQTDLGDALYGQWINNDAFFFLIYSNAARTKHYAAAYARDGKTKHEIFLGETLFPSDYDRAFLGSFKDTAGNNVVMFQVAQQSSTASALTSAWAKQVNHAYMWTVETNNLIAYPLSRGSAQPTFAYAADFISVPAHAFMASYSPNTDDVGVFMNLRTGTSKGYWYTQGDYWDLLWSPDGKWGVLRNYTGSGNILSADLIPADGGLRRYKLDAPPLPLFFSGYAPLQWADDGKSLFSIRSDMVGRFGYTLTRLDVETGIYHPIVSGVRGAWPIYSTNSYLLFAEANGETQLLHIDFSGSAQATNQQEAKITVLTTGFSWVQDVVNGYEFNTYVITLRWPSNHPDAPMAAYWFDSATKKFLLLEGGFQTLSAPIIDYNMVVNYFTWQRNPPAGSASTTPIYGATGFGGDGKMTHEFHSQHPISWLYFSPQGNYAVLNHMQPNKDDEWWAEIAGNQLRPTADKNPIVIGGPNTGIKGYTYSASWSADDAQVAVYRNDFINYNITDLHVHNLNTGQTRDFSQKLSINTVEWRQCAIDANELQPSYVGGE
jgi:hypothetical protein